VSVTHPASFKSEVDWRTGGPEGLWLLHGIFFPFISNQKALDNCFL